MSDSHSTTSTDPIVSVPLWFWIVAGIALLWNLMGTAAFAAQMMMTEEALAPLPEDQQELYRNIPGWVNIAFGFAVFGGVLGSIGLLMRKRWATFVFVLSLLGVIGQQSYMYLFSDTMAIMGAGAAIFPTIVLLASVGLIVLAIVATQRRWIR